LEAEIDDFLARLLEEIVGSADDQLQILAFFSGGPRAVRSCVEGRFVEDPLRSGVEQTDERLGHDLAIKPEMHAGDGSVDYFVEIAESGVSLLEAFGKKLGEREMREGDDVSISGFFAAFVEEDRDQLAALDAQT